MSVAPCPIQSNSIPSKLIHPSGHAVATGRQMSAHGDQGLKNVFSSTVLMVRSLTSILTLCIRSGLSFQWPCGSCSWAPRCGYLLQPLLTPSWGGISAAQTQPVWAWLLQGTWAMTSAEPWPNGLGAMEGVKCNVFYRISGTVAISPLPLPQVSLKWLAKGSRWSEVWTEGWSDTSISRGTLHHMMGKWQSDCTALIQVVVIARVGSKHSALWGKLSICKEGCRWVMGREEERGNMAVLDNWVHETDVGMT